MPNYIDVRGVFSFTKSVENGEDTLWLSCKNAMINLNHIAALHPGVVGTQFKKAIQEALSGKVGKPDVMEEIRKTNGAIPEGFYNPPQEKASCQEK